MASSPVINSIAPLCVEPVSGVIACEGCETGLTDGGVVNHLKSKHGCHPASAKLLNTSALSRATFIRSSTSCERDMYCNAPEKRRGNGQPRVYKALRFLKVHDGFQCSRCEKCFKVSKNIKSHGDREHNGSGDVVLKEALDAGTVKVQTLYGGSRQRYFQVDTGVVSAIVSGNTANTPAPVTVPAPGGATSSAPAEIIPVVCNSGVGHVAGNIVGTLPSTRNETTSARGFGESGVGSGLATTRNGATMKQGMAAADVVYREPVFSKSIRSANAGRSESVALINACREAGAGSSVELPPSTAVVPAVSKQVTSGRTMHQPASSGSMNLLMDTFKPAAVEENHVVGGVHGELVSAFGEAIQVLHNLKKFNISMEDAYNLQSIPDELKEISLTVFGDLESYFNLVMELRSEIADCLLISLNLVANRKYNHVRENARERYSKHIGDMILYFMRLSMYENNGMDNKLVGCIEMYKALADGDEDIRLYWLHRILCCLCLQQLALSDSKRRLHILRYITVMSVTRDITNGGVLGRVRICAPKEMSHLFAGLQKIITGTAICEVVCISKRALKASSGSARICLENDAVNGMVAKWVDVMDGSGDLGRFAVGTPDSCTKNVVEAVDLGGNTPAALVRGMLDTCMRSMKNETVDGNLVECLTHDYCLFVDNVELSMGQLGAMCRKEQELCVTHMDKELFMGMSLPSDYRNIIEKLVDVPRNLSPGHSFRREQRNAGPLQRLMNMFWQHLKEQARFTGGIGENTAAAEVLHLGDVSIWKSAARKWVIYADIVQVKLAILLHATGGSPGRATEVCTFNLQNTNTQRRHLYVLNGRCYIVSAYSKTRSLTGNDCESPRFVDMKTSELLLKFFIFIKPVQAMLIQALSGGQHRVEQMMEPLFTFDGVRLEAGRLRKAVETFFGGGGVDFNVSMYRTWTSGMVDMITDGNDVFGRTLVDEYREVGHLQANHTEDIADRIYTRRVNDHASFGHTKRKRYFMWCCQWHEKLGLADSSPQVVYTSPPHAKGDSANRGVKRGAADAGLGSGSGSGSGSLEPSQKRSRNNDLNVTPSSGMATPPLAIRPTGIGSSVTPREPLVRRSDVIHLRNSDVSGSPVPRVAVHYPIPRNFHDDAHILLPALRDMLKDGNALFRSQMQSDVCATVLSGSSDVVAILPTAAGKTVCFLLPCFIERNQKCSIVIVPLVALKAELYDRCCRYGLSAAMWRKAHCNPNSWNGIDVFLVSMEHLDWDSFHSFSRKLASSGKLARIVVDEAHLSVLWASFRPCLYRLGLTMTHLPGHVRRILFTATVPPRDVQDLLIKHGVNTAIVYRNPSVRKNISIKVVLCPGVRVDDYFGNILNNLVDGLRDVIEINRSRQRGSRVLVYGLRIADNKKVFEHLSESHVSINPIDIELLMYFGKMEENEKTEAQKKWSSPLSKATRVMICTNAFGTGVDCSDVFNVFHIGGSNSLVEYAQEIGRAGRDGSPANATLFYSEQYARSISIAKAANGGGAGSNGDQTGSARVGEAAYLSTALFNEFQNWAESATICRKNSLYEVIDGAGPGLCAYDTSSLNCDVCATLLSNRTTNNNEQPDCPVPLDHGLSLGNPIRRQVVSGTWKPEAGNEAEHRPNPGNGISPSSALARSLPRSTGRDSSHSSLQGSSSIAVGRNVPRTIPRSPVTSRVLFAPGSSRTRNVAVESTNPDKSIEILVQVNSMTLKELYKCFEEIKEQVKGRCAVCILRQHNVHPKEVHLASNWCPTGVFCGNCLARGHYRTNCPALREHDNVRCQKCLLSHLPGIFAHTYETLGRKTCEYVTCAEICFRLFHICWRDDVILKFLMSTSEQTEYLCAQSVRSGPAKMKHFYSWLAQNVSHKQNVVRMTVCWAKLSERLVLSV